MPAAIHRFVPRAHVVIALALTFFLCATFGARATGAQAAGSGLSSAAWDSVRASLASADWNERHGALVRVNGAYPDALPAALTGPIVALLTKEAAVSGSFEGNEEFGEYIVDLVLTGVRTRDARTIPAILALDGLGMSSGVAAFVASQGPSMMPTLDALARTRDDRGSDVVETYALMYARYGSRLERADSVQLLRRLIAAASDTSSVVRSQVVQVAARGPISELQPVVADLAVSDPRQIDGLFFVRQDAAEALPAVTRALAGVARGELLNRLTLLTDAACDGADGPFRGQCTALSAHLATAARSVEVGQPEVAAGALDSYRRAAQRLGADGLVPRLTAVALDGTARAVIGRL